MCGYPYMGIPPRVQQTQNAMKSARNHIDLMRAYGNDAGEIIDATNRHQIDDRTMNELFRVHNALYEALARRFPCAPKTVNEVVQLESITGVTGPRSFSRGWLEWELSGRRPTPRRSILNKLERRRVAPTIERWIRCEYIRPANMNGDYMLGEEGMRLRSALNITKRFPAFSLEGLT